jgi:hypothetical protein
MVIMLADLAEDKVKRESSVMADICPESPQAILAGACCVSVSSGFRMLAVRVVMAKRAAAWCPDGHCPPAAPTLMESGPMSCLAQWD